MHVAILSDLHVEGAAYKLELPLADILILAGDIDSKHPSGITCGQAFRSRVYTEYGQENVLEIDGNHTAYGGYISDFSNRQICKVVGDTVFIGATLWSGIGSEFAYEHLNDRFIGDFSWEWMNSRHKSDVSFILECLEKHKDKKCVVFTHHLPSLECVHSKWLVHGTGGINLAFYTDLDKIINDYAPIMWVFGHTHDSVHKFHSNGKTQLVCNPRGYRHYDGTYENRGFTPTKVVEI